MKPITSFGVNHYFDVILTISIQHHSSQPIVFWQSISTTINSNKTLYLQSCIIQYFWIIYMDIKYSSKTKTIVIMSTINYTRKQISIIPTASWKFQIHLYLVPIVLIPNRWSFPGSSTHCSYDWVYSDLCTKFLKSFWYEITATSNIITVVWFWIIISILI